MTDTEMTCERFEERLADYMEGDLHGAERAAMDAHVARCAACGTLVADLRGIVAEAAALPAIEPPASVWAGIESRIATEVVPLAPRRRSISLVRAITAAAAMVLVTATVTYMATIRLNPANQSDRAGQQVVAQGSASPSTTSQPTVTDPLATGAREPDVSQPTRSSAGVPDASPVRTVSRAERTAGRAADAAAVYDEEISRLRSVIRRREDLDPKTIAAIQRSLAVIDTAIAQARAAVAADPASAFLNKRLADAQNKKVELLRTAATLPST
jgi:anti-sigma factor ChrR (cupin superfamily)